MLDSTSYRSNAYIAVAIGVLVFGLCAYNAKKAFVRKEDRTRSLIYLAVRRYGDDTEAVSRMIDREATSNDVRKYGTFTLTSSWLLQKTFFSFTPFHLMDIIWVYRKRTQHSYYFIPTGKSHSIVIADACGRKAESDLGRGEAKEKRVEEFIATIGASVPWIIAGYSNELKDLYEKNRQEFVSAVEQRHRQYKQQNT
jgi:hypothetical protein